ncbi:hypothetical protein E2C01_077873 [Portunus trituberculatus]|uniref:Uncharacterized protein n=1 Tax=Portunus trituberculatus TaxID=210409 RepID=A0A5B7ISM2_PORTR|nr:hypothetical protein [Portunus trituberculatus]
MRKHTHTHTHTHKHKQHIPSRSHPNALTGLGVDAGGKERWRGRRWPLIRQRDEARGVGASGSPARILDAKSPLIRSGADQTVTQPGHFRSTLRLPSAAPCRTARSNHKGRGNGSRCY